MSKAMKLAHKQKRGPWKLAAMERKRAAQRAYYHEHKVLKKDKGVRMEMSQYVLARRLQKAVTQALREGEPLDDMKITAHLLCERILNNG